MVEVAVKQEGRNRLSGLLFNHKRYNVLAYLLTHEDEQMTIGDIIENVDVSRPHVTNFVNDLRDLGLVEKQKKGNLYLITVNQDSPYYSALKQLLSIDAEPLKEAAEDVIGTVLEQKLFDGETVGDQVVAVYLFGSVARGTPSIDSDIDILVVHRDDSLTPQKKDEVRDMFEERGDDLKVSFSLTFYAQEEWERDRKRGIAFVERVADEGIRLHGEQL